MTQPATPDNALNALKSLLLGEERHQLEEINERLEDPELRSEDFAEVLPDALRLSQARGGDLADALEPPVTQCIQRSITRDPDNFANALYPVMGPAIRQSISQTLKGLVENINRSLEQSFSIQGLKWRLEARRSGVPFAEVVLRHTLAFRVEQVFLIQPGSGLLMQHVQDEIASEGDADAISGMLTAITQFVKDAFHAQDNEGLETVALGDHTVLLVHGPHAYLAALVRGVVPSELRLQCQEALEDLHRRFRARLSEFKGDRASLDPLVPTLQLCLQSRAREAEKKKGLSPALIIVLATILLLLAWFGWHSWQQFREAAAWQARQEALVASLDSEAGIVVTDVAYGGKLQLRGLRDPLARPTADLLAAAEVAEDQVKMQWRSYHDLDPRFVLQRARQKLSPPPTVSLDLENGVLTARGYADRDWLRRAEVIATAMSGINAFDDTQLDSVDEYLRKEASTRLSPPAEVELGVEQRMVKLSGVAPADWMDTIAAKLDSLPELSGIDRRELVSKEQIHFQQLHSRIENSFVYFPERSELGPEQQDVLAHIATDLQTLETLGERIQRPFGVLLIGSADGFGPSTLNAQLALERALQVREQLVALGLPDALFQVQTRVGQLPVLDPNLRRTEFRILFKGGD